jgi:hypothetical protein
MVCNKAHLKRFKSGIDVPANVPSRKQPGGGARQLQPEAVPGTGSMDAKEHGKKAPEQWMAELWDSVEHDYGSREQDDGNALDLACAGRRKDLASIEGNENWDWNS